MLHHQSLAHAYLFFINKSYSLQKETRMFNQVIKDQVGKYINNLIKSLVSLFFFVGSPITSPPPTTTEGI